AYAAQVRARRDAALDKGQGAPRYLTDILKRILTSQSDADGYLVLCDGSPTDAADCEALARIHEQHGEPEDALSWVERGLALLRQGRAGSTSAAQLERRQLELLELLGRTSEAIELVWQRFESSPSPSTYATLMQMIPSRDRDAWHAKAMTAVGPRKSY